MLRGASRGAASVGRCGRLGGISRCSRRRGERGRPVDRPVWRRFEEKIEYTLRKIGQLFSLKNFDSVPPSYSLYQNGCALLLSRGPWRLAYRKGQLVCL